MSVVDATANCWTWASVLVAEPLLESGMLKFLSSKRNALCVVLSFGCQCSLFGVGKDRFSTNCHPGSWLSRGDWGN